MNPVITDLTKSSSAKPIELVSCLQGSKNVNSEHYFYKGGSYKDYLRGVDKITRLSTFILEDNVRYDLIETDANGLKNIFLGHWNDGVVD